MRQRDVIIAPHPDGFVLIWPDSGKRIRFRYADRGDWRTTPSFTTRARAWLYARGQGWRVVNEQDGDDFFRSDVPLEIRSRP
jgi:hypothetical protein